LNATVFETWRSTLGVRS